MNRLIGMALLGLTPAVLGLTVPTTPMAVFGVGTALVGVISLGVSDATAAPRRSRDLFENEEEIEQSITKDEQDKAREDRTGRGPRWRGYDDKERTDCQTEANDSGALGTDADLRCDAYRRRR